MALCTRAVNTVSKLVKTMVTSLIILVSIGIIAIVFVFYVNNDNDRGKAQSIDEIVEYSYETPEITTDLQDGSFVRIQFQVLTDGKSAKKEVVKREFQLKNILIKELAKMNADDFKADLGELEDDIQSKLNEVMTEGNITDGYTTNSFTIINTY